MQWSAALTTAIYFCSEPLRCPAMVSSAMRLGIRCLLSLACLHSWVSRITSHAHLSCWLLRQTSWT